MTGSKPPISEAEELDSFFAELERGNEVREIAGWESGFTALSRALNGISPGLYLLIGPPACGKSAFAKQLLDQVARRNSVPAIFFTCAEKKADLRIRTLARLSGLETREIRRGAGYLLHTYGVPKQHVTQQEEMAPGWDKLKLAAEEAKSWLDLVYMSECDGKTTLNDIEQQIREVRELKRSQSLMVAIDDSQRLGDVKSSFDARLPVIAEKLHDLTLRLNLPLFATWPDLQSKEAPQQWPEKIADADVIIVMREDAERTKRLSEPNQAIALHIVKNRAGEKATLQFEFSPALSKFSEYDSNP
jgi:replicative DNA helicase